MIKCFLNIPESNLLFSSKFDRLRVKTYPRHNLDGLVSKLHSSSDVIQMHVVHLLGGAVHSGAIVRALECQQKKETTFRYSSACDLS